MDKTTKETAIFGVVVAVAICVILKSASVYEGIRLKAKVGQCYFIDSSTVMRVEKVLEYGVVMSHPKADEPTYYGILRFDRSSRADCPETWKKEK